MGLGLFVAVGGVASYCSYGIAGGYCHSATISPLYYIGQSTMLVGVILAAAGFVVGRLRPSEVRKTEDVSLREADSQNSNESP